MPLIQVLKKKEMCKYLNGKQEPDYIVIKLCIPLLTLHQIPPKRNALPRPNKDHNRTLTLATFVLVERFKNVAVLKGKSLKIIAMTFLLA